jgi:hypothetical protein
MSALKFARGWRVASVVTLALLCACATQGGSGDKSGGGRPGDAANGAAAGKAAGAQQAAPNPTPTLLKFDWGNEVDADVFAIREEFTFKGDTERISRLEANFHLHAVRVGDRYSLSFSELAMKLDGRPIPVSAQPAMIGPITGLVLNYDIAANGDFIGQHDFERLQAYAERSYTEQNEKLPPEKRPTPEEARQAMKSGSSREVLQLEATRTWGALVGMWAGITMTEGKPLGSESSVIIPVVNVPLTVQSKFELVRREECATGERRKDCVRLRATSRPDPAQLAVAQRKLRESLNGRVEPLAMNGLQVEDRYELLTDPQTMRPRWAEWVRGADIEGAEQGSGLLDSRQSTRTRMIFVYGGD